ncbi:MarR family transcriptional regulator [Chromatiales bacterium (ex Bugula neritina AB1)]|nr:MarR family transcriptional regulator [Chromatiales bacterium (ex Bugula neritina AB1)]
MNSGRKSIPSEEASKTRLRLWLRTLKVSRMIEAELREKLRKQFATTLPRFDVMAGLYQYHEGLKMSELSGLLKVSNGNVTGIVDRLVKDGLVLRSEVPGDRRALRVRLSGNGRAEFSRQAAAHEIWIDELLGNLSVTDAEAVLGHFDSIIPGLGPDRKKAEY